MSQCVPDWDLDDSGNNHPTPPRISLRSRSFNISTPDVPVSNYEVAELTWENGQLAMHGLGPPRPAAKPLPTSSASHSKYAWVDKPRSAAPANAAPSAAAGGAGTGTLECIVNQAAALPRRKLPFDAAAADLVPWFDHSRGSSAAASATMTMDALVPCAGAADDRTTAHFVDSAPPGGGGGGVVGCSTRVGSCGGAAAGPAQEEDALAARKRARGRAPRRRRSGAGWTRA
ncbi:hypothetical protein NL676_011854 [Syzygium grande]|nr:hypothetical protein NL676_011854 [Syzygium grande]